MLAQQVDLNLDKLNDRKVGPPGVPANRARIVSIVNDEGSEIAPSIFISAAPKDIVDGKEVVNSKRFEAFRKSLPLEAMKESQSSGKATKMMERPIIVGMPYMPDGRAVPVVPVVVPASRKSSLFSRVNLLWTVWMHASCMFLRTASIWLCSIPRRARLATGNWAGRCR